MGRKPIFDLEDTKIIGKSPESNKNIAKLAKCSIQTVNKARDKGILLNENEFLRKKLNEQVRKNQELITENFLLKNKFIITNSKSKTQSKKRISALNYIVKKAIKK